MRTGSKATGRVDAGARPCFQVGAYWTYAPPSPFSARPEGQIFVVRSTARNKGPTACSNVLTVRQDRLESIVLDGLRDRLMNPVPFEALAAEFTVEWNRLQSLPLCLVDEVMRARAA